MEQGHLPLPSFISEKSTFSPVQRCIFAAHGHQPIVFVIGPGGIAVYGGVEVLESVGDCGALLKKRSNESEKTIIVPEFPVLYQNIILGANGLCSCFVVMADTIEIGPDDILYSRCILWCCLARRKEQARKHKAKVFHGISPVMYV